MSKNCWELSLSEIRKIRISNKELLLEISESKKKGELTDRAIEMLVILARKLQTTLSYKDSDDQIDCLSFAVLDLMNYWDRFDESKSSNAFAYYTSIATKGLAKGWNKLHPKKYSNTISMDGDAGGNGAIYSL